MGRSGFGIGISERCFLGIFLEGVKGRLETAVFPSLSARDHFVLSSCFPFPQSLSAASPLLRSDWVPMPSVLPFRYTLAHLLFHGLVTMHLDDEYQRRIAYNRNIEDP